MTYVSHIQQALKALPGTKWMGDAGRIRSMLTRPKALCSSSRCFLLRLSRADSKLLFYPFLPRRLRTVVLQRDKVAIGAQVFSPRDQFSTDCVQRHCKRRRKRGLFCFTHFLKQLYIQLCSGGAEASSALPGHCSPASSDGYHHGLSMASTLWFPMGCWALKYK